MPSRVLYQSLALAVAGVLTAAPGALSDPIGAYAVIDRVVLEPDAANPRSIQLWGTFAVADQSNRNDYQPVERGYMYFALPGTNQRAALAEWTDFSRLAGTAEPVGFGRRFDLMRVRPASETARAPDPYPLGFGMIRMARTQHRLNIQYELLRVPQPVTPAEGARVAQGNVRLVTRNVPDTTVRYIFEIEGADGKRETSAALSAGPSETSWTPQLRVQPGAQYTWRVWVVKDSWRGQPATATFRAAE